MIDLCHSRKSSGGRTGTKPSLTLSDLDQIQILHHDELELKDFMRFLRIFTMAASEVISFTFFTDLLSSCMDYLR